MDFDSLKDDSTKTVQPMQEQDQEPVGSFDSLVADEDNPLTYAKRAITNKLAMASGIARAGTLGLSDVALTKTGLVEPETLKKLEEEAPVSTFGGEMLGGGATSVLTGGFGLGAIAKGAVGKAAALAGEGALFGSGNAVSDYALGDPDLNAQKVLSHIGMGAGAALGLGALAKGIEAALPFGAKKIGQVAEAIKGKELPPMPTEGAAPVVDAIPQKGVQPTSYQEIADRVKNAKFTGETLELPGKQLAADAASRVEMMNPIHPMQLDSLGDQGSRDVYNTAKEMQGAEGEALRSYETLQKNELKARTENELELIAPGHKPIDDAVKGGDHAIDAFTENYKKEQDELSPIFEKFKSEEISDRDHTTGMVNSMVDAVPGISKMFEVKDGQLVKLPYSETGGSIDKATYNAAGDVVGFLKGKNKPETIRDLLDIRKSLDQHVDVMAQGEAASQIRAIKASLMDYIQNVSNNPEIRETLKRYAINQQERSVIEKAFGASVGTPEFGAISKIKPEMIGDKIFSNTATVEAAKKILEPKKFNEILANWLSENKAKVTDKGVFSSNKWGSFLKRNQDALNVAFADNPKALQNLQDYTTIMRLLPDAPSINPSGTAKTLMGMLSKTHGMSDVAGVALNFFKEQTLGRIEHEIALNNLNNKLAGQSAKSTVLSELGSMIKKTNDKISSGAKSIFNNNFIRGGVISGGAQLLDYDKNVKKINDYATNPQVLMDHMVAHSDNLYENAPSITQGLHNSMIAAVQYLHSIAPKPNNELALSSEWQPTKSQKAAFNRSFEAVGNPLIALKQVKDGTLSNETMAALQVVHPHLLEEMQQKVMENINPKIASKLNYSTKISLSKFLQHPLDEGMIPQVLMANQATFAMPAQKQSQMVGKSTVGGMKELDFADRARTRTQKEDVKV
jgi:hypothetical protein